MRLAAEMSRLRDKAYHDAKIAVSLIDGEPLGIQ
jgi:hypothetical protein